ncbi:MAG: hypothetical protein ACE5FI_17880 [Anaerolineales bacterium]
MKPAPALAGLVVLALAAAAGLSVRADVCYRERSGAPYRAPTPPPMPAPGTPLPAAFTPPAATHIAFDQIAPLVTPISWRFGVGVPGGPGEAVWVPRLGAGWWIDWSVLPPGAVVAGGEHWQIVRLSRGRVQPALATLALWAAQRPGQTWIVGNEPDVVLQDNVTPACFARRYHEVYYALKRADPTAQVAVGAVAQATPLRLAYLDQVLAAYERQFGEPLPVDVWTLHGYVLPEQRFFWGVGIPPGFIQDYGVLRGHRAHADIAIFAGQIQAFRRWMAQHGYRERPLALTEFGIVLSSEYGFTDEQVQNFMYAAFDYLLNAHDSRIGYPADADRLVQRWAWFSSAYAPIPRSDLIDVNAGTLTVLGAAYRAYVETGGRGPRQG